jgi:hypothetical protein
LGFWVEVFCSLCSWFVVGIFLAFWFGVVVLLYLALMDGVGVRQLCALLVRGLVGVRYVPFW